jgi:DNA excision repair protein ERCC-4
MRKAHRLFEQIVLVVDSREQCPYRFKHPTVPGSLPTGDYSILGFEDKVAIERKSVEDLVGCLKGQNRERFERELQRSRALDYFALVLEGSLSDLAAGQYRSEMTPASVVQSVLALAVRHRVPVWFAESRQMGQRITESLLEKYARDVCKRFSELQGSVGQNQEKRIAV